MTTGSFCTLLNLSKNKWIWRSIKFITLKHLEMRSADEVFRLSYCGAHLVHPADEVLVPANFLGRRPTPVPWKHDDDSPLGPPSITNGQMPKLFQGKLRQILILIDALFYLYTLYVQKKIGHRVMWARLSPIMHVLSSSVIDRFRFFHI